MSMMDAMSGRGDGPGDSLAYPSSSSPASDSQTHTSLFPDSEYIPLGPPPSASPSSFRPEPFAASLIPDTEFIPLGHGPPRSTGPHPIGPESLVQAKDPPVSGPGTLFSSFHMFPFGSEVSEQLPLGHVGIGGLNDPTRAAYAGMSGSHPGMPPPNGMPPSLDGPDPSMFQPPLGLEVDPVTGVRYGIGAMGERSQNLHIGENPPGLAPLGRAPGGPRRTGGW